MTGLWSFVCICVRLPILAFCLHVSVLMAVFLLPPTPIHPMSLLQNKGSLQFEDKWDLMRPIVLKLLRQEAVTKQQWFDLFS